MTVQDTARIPLRARDGSIRAYAIVDAADAAWANQWRWCLDSDGYAIRTEYAGPGQSVRLFRLHRELLGLRTGDGIEGDHINRDRIDCRRANLRIATRLQNAQNKSKRGETTSRHKGVYWFARRGTWHARISVQGKRIHLGFFSDEEEAGRVAQAARLRWYSYAVD